MISEQHLAQEFLTVIDNFYPKVGAVLHHCYIKVIETYIGRIHKRLYYLGIYCSDATFAEVEAQRDVLREVAENMGLVEVVCINATRLLRDPRSTLKDLSPRLWLELYWISTKAK
ncbi:MAG: hypothetical protein ACM37W_09025 [Actinomycetota bacterium]